MGTTKKVKAPKTYWVKTDQNGVGGRPDRIKYVKGTVEELIKYFGYTLEVGYSWNSKINKNPTTIRGFVSNLQKSYDEKEGSCYSRTSVYHVQENEVPEEFKKKDQVA